MRPPVGDVVSWLTVAAALLTAANGQYVEVIDFQPSGYHTKNTTARYMGVIQREQLLDSLTFCFRFKFNVLHDSATVMKLLDTPTGEDELLIGILFIDRIRTMFSGRRKFQPLKKELRVKRWHHVCFLYDDPNKVISSYVDGVLNYIEDYYIPGEARGDDVWLGQGAVVSIDENSFSGQLTQLNVWDYALTEKEVLDMQNCLTDPQGNYVSWKKGWTLYNTESFQELLPNMCQSADALTTYQWFPDLPMLDAFYICDALGGSLPLCTNAADAEFYHDLAATLLPNETECKTKFWSPVGDFAIDGQWMSTSRPQEKADIYWAKNEPDGIIYQQCALIYPKGLRDVTCPFTSTCAACVISKAVIFSLRGTCETDKRHVYFTSDQASIGNIEFLGFGGYHIEFENNVWSWRERKGAAIIAEMVPTDVYNYPLGRKIWNLKQPLCGQDSGERVILFTPCLPDQFTCSDAKCIPLERRCDLKYDCNDHSDEVDCKLVEFPEGYQYDLPPRQLTPTDSGLSGLPIQANITIKSIDVDTMQMNMFVSYEFEMTWLDNRLEYWNLKTLTSLNILPYSILLSLWSPAVSFSNTEGGHATLVDIKTSMFITRLANSTKRELSVPGEVEIYPGSENILTMSRKYATDFSCDFNLILYPFDDQYCDMVLQMASASTDYIRFDVILSNVTFLGNPLLLEYEMSSPVVQLGPDKEFSQLIVRVPLSRRFGYAVLNIYTPSAILLVISFVTLYFQPHIFDVRVMSVLTVLLVTATLFTQVSSSLPKTSYFKMVDIWLLFCIVMNFLIILLHAIVDYSYHVQRSLNLRGLAPNGTKKERTKVMPMNEPELKTMHAQRMSFDDDEDIPSMPLNLSLATLVKLSKFIVFGVFLFFSFCYWGYILF